jgi:hypothetical protein
MGSKNMDIPYSYQSEFEDDTGKSIQHKSGEWGPDRNQMKKPALFDSLQIAGLLLIVVFILGVISAVAIAMFDIHVLALTEFEDDGKADVSGFVTDTEGQYLVNVTVAIHGTHHFTRTNLEGYYSIDNVKEGDYEIEASLNDYGSVTKRVSLNANSPTLVNFMLEEGGFDETKNERYGSNLSDLQHLNYATAVLILVYGTFAFIGGIFAYLKKYYWIAMFGALCGIVAGMLSIGIIIGPILSILGLYLIVKNQEEFVTSEKSYVDRIFGVGRVESRPIGVPRAVAGQPGTARGMRKLKPKRAPQAYAQQSMPPQPSPYVDEVQQAEPDTPDGMSDADVLSTECRACGGTVKPGTQGVMCSCGVSYHKFCADSISRCKSCGEPL